MFERFDLEGAVAIGHFDAQTATRRQRHDLVGREFAFVENVEHFPPDIAGRSDQRDFVTHRSLSEEKCLVPSRSGKGRGSASMRETPSRQRYLQHCLGLTWTFDAIVSGFPCPPILSEQNSSGAD